METRTDSHSYSQPDKIRVRHVDLDLDVRFQERKLAGSAILSFERADGEGDAPLILDTRDLSVAKTEGSADGAAWSEVPFEIGKSDPILGAPLTIRLPAGARQVRVSYSTSPKASALQWLEPEQTAGKKHPFLYTQSQAIHARSWIPLQDTPGVRVTYSARIRTPEELLAVMSAENDPAPGKAEYRFRMPQPIPSYLIALAVGALEFRPMSERTGVYAEPSVVSQAASEFEDTEKMMQAAEGLFGPYRWGRYDILVLPPSFPYGGMENPRLTFATPTILAGDKSLVALVAHELAHSWSGNLVTNATWRDFWLNEGFTVYLERRIQEKVYGAGRAAMEAALDYRELQEELARLEDRDEILHIDLSGRDPDEGVTSIPYIKGSLFLRTLEEAFGREAFDGFLRGYFDHFSFQSITTADFLAYLQEKLFPRNPAAGARIALERWLREPGLPESAPRAESDAFTKVEQSAQQWLRGEADLKSLSTGNWSTHEWLHFLSSLPEDLGAEKMNALDAAFGFTRSGNSEILQKWLVMSVRSSYTRAYAALDEFLLSVGRRKFIKPLYEELAKTPAGRERARRIYRQARSRYHPIAASTIDGILNWRE